MIGDAEQIAAFQAVGPGRMTVTADESGFGYEFRFRISGLTNTVTISDDEAIELAEATLT